MKKDRVWYLSESKAWKPRGKGAPRGEPGKWALERRAFGRETEVELQVTTCKCCPNSHADKSRLLGMWD